MDGNGRWAQQRYHLRSFGHKSGTKAVRQAIRAAMQLGVPELTLFAFSSENWSRPSDEVGFLLRLFLNALNDEIDEMHINGIRVCFIGDCARFGQPLIQAMNAAEQKTAGNQRLRLNIAVGYGGRWDITQAVRRIASLVQQGLMQPDAIDEAQLSNHLSLSQSPDPDLLIRTGGERRISNFLIWQMSYTELYFSDTLWPDFDEAAFTAAIEWYGGRVRRYGAVPDATAEN